MPHFSTLWRVLTLILIFSPAASAFGRLGHAAVAELAQRHLLPDVKYEVLRLLGDPGDLVETRNLWEVSVWADEVRFKSKEQLEKLYPNQYFPSGFADSNFFWHFVEIKNGETLKTAKKNPKSDLYQVIVENYNILKNPKAPRTERQFALKMLIHMIADVHQPLHVGKGTDQGGNLVKVWWTAGQIYETNLHSVWDVNLVEHSAITQSASEFATFLDHFTAQEIKKLQSTGVETWIEESIALRKSVYEVGNGRLGWDYLARHRPTIRRRLGEAGIRLAGMLNELFSKK